MGAVSKCSIKLQPAINPPEPSDDVALCLYLNLDCDYNLSLSQSTSNAPTKDIKLTIQSHCIETAAGAESRLKGS